jgi:DNA (cytosine-5)-methyltransferase 1
MTERERIKKRARSIRRPTCIDIFCGAGGTTYGAIQAGLNVVYGLDIDKSAIQTFARNHPKAYSDCRDVASVTAQEILNLSGVDRIDYLLSGPNCQAVSQMGLFWRDDPRNLMFVHLARLLDEFIALGKTPQNVIIENVPSIAYKKNIRIVQDLVKFFIERGYRCGADVVSFATWGLPQLRHRFILLATMSPHEPRLPAPVASLETGKGLVTAWDAIGDLTAVQPVPHGTTATARAKAKTSYQRTMRRADGVVHNHHEGRTAQIDIERIKRIPPGGSWKDIPAELLPDRFRKVRMTDYKTLYGRMLKGHPAYTIYSAYGNVTSGCFTHPEHHRPLTVREGCRLQGFPDDFVVTGSVPSQYHQIGNAVPALAAKVLLEHWQLVLRGKQPPSEPMRLNPSVLTSSPLRLPVLTPRYARLGYGTGTYWPKGWGDAPSDLPTASSDYRISKDPVNYRRTRWRNLRDEKMTESIHQVLNLDWQAFLSAIKEAPGAAVLLDGIDTSDSLPGSGKDLARQRFMRFLAPAGAAVSSLAAQQGRVTVHCDFGLTAGWLFKFLGYLIEDQALSIRVQNADVTEEVGPQDARATVFLTTARVPPDKTSALVLAHPFTGMNGFSRAGARPIPVPGACVRATLLPSHPFHTKSASSIGRRNRDFD